jgi:hypothetical protein
MTWWRAPREWITPLNQRGPFGEFLASAGQGASFDRSIPLRIRLPRTERRSSRLGLFEELFDGRISRNTESQCLEIMFVR